MTTVWPFLAKFASLIVCMLHCFDRMIFKGHLAKYFVVAARADRNPLWTPSDRPVLVGTGPLAFNNGQWRSKQPP
jgi:hypothetical protein